MRKVLIAMAVLVGAAVVTYAGGAGATSAGITITVSGEVPDTLEVTSTDFNILCGDLIDIHSCETDTVTISGTTSATSLSITPASTTVTLGTGFVVPLTVGAPTVGGGAFSFAITAGTAEGPVPTGTAGSTVTSGGASFTISTL